MEDENARMAAMQAEFQETIAKLREDFTARMRVLEASNKSMWYSWDDGRDDGMVSRDVDMPRQQQQQQPLQQPLRGIPLIGGDGEDGSTPPF